MKNFILFSFAILVAAFLDSCSCGCGATQKDSIPVYHQIAAVKYGVNYSVIFNPDSSYVLCTNNGGAPGKVPPKALRFFVFNLITNKIVLEDTYASASVKWIKKYKLMVRVYPEAFSLKKNQNLVKVIYDVKKGTKIKIKK